MNKDEIKDTTEKQGTNKHNNTNLINVLQLNCFLSWLFISGVRSLSYGVNKNPNVPNNNHNERVFFLQNQSAVKTKTKII